VSGEATIVEHVTCLGCGCACDDIAITVRDGRIAESRNACALGASWFGDGAVPADARIGGAAASRDAALDAAAAILRRARRALVYLAPDISVETQRAAVGLADHLHAVVDDAGAAAVAPAILAGQRRGRVVATLGELRNRADLVVFWGVDPAERYPRFTQRVALGGEGLFVGGARTIVAVDVGDAVAAADAAARFAVGAGDELDALAVLRARLAGRPVGDTPLVPRLDALAERLRTARYAAIVYDAEPAARGAAAAASSARAESLIALAQTLSAVTRCALCALRAGGNRTGAELVLAWQTGFPMRVDFSRGAPRYRPDDDALSLLRSARVDAFLAVGDVRNAPALGAGTARRVVIGPRASLADPTADVAIDSAVAGIHEGGTAYRMDEIPLPLRASLAGPPAAAGLVAALAERLA